MDNVDWSSGAHISFFHKEFQNWNQKINISLLLVADTDAIESLQIYIWFVASFLNLIWVVEIANRQKKEADTEVQQNDRNNF